MATRAASTSTARQRGIVMLAMLAMVVLLAGGVVLAGLRTASQNQSGNDETTTRALAAARAALIGWAVSEPDFPGGLPLPDRNGDGDYNGFSDCTSVTALPAPAGAALPNVAIGRLPWRGLEANCLSNATLGGLSSNLRGGSGEGLWYAVSANLLRVGSGAPLNQVLPPRVDWSEPTAAPVFSWLTVVDANGAVLSNRVAFVVIAPGAPVWRGDLGGGGAVQDRPVATPAGADRYLDRFTVGGTTYDNANVNNQGVFVVAPDNTRGPEGAPAGTDGFNDRLVYVTIDELMPLVAERVLDEAGRALIGYLTPPNIFSIYVNPRMPWAAPFADPALQASYKSTPGQRFGLLPMLFPNEWFATPMVVSWRNLTNVSVTRTGTVSTAHLTSPSAFTTLTPPGAGNCLWEFEFRMTCTHTGVQSVTVGTGAMTPWGVPCPALGCQRRTSLVGTVRLEQAPAVMTEPTATATRTRQVRSSAPRLPVQTFGVQMDDFECTSADCSSGATQVGSGTLANTTTTSGEIIVSGVRHELTVVDRFNPLYVDRVAYRSDLPHWFFTGGWYRRMLYGVANGLQPGGAGACTVGTDCITVDTLGADGGLLAIDNTVRKMLVFGGGPVAANDPLVFTASQLGRYFEGDNANGDERFARPASVGVRNLLSTPRPPVLFPANTFNDQFRVIPP